MTGCQLVSPAVGPKKFLAQNIDLSKINEILGYIKFMQ